MHLRAHGEIVHAIGELADASVGGTLPELKELLVDAIGQPIRRISRFMQLALIGAGRCARGKNLPRDTAVYLASSRGDLEITIDVMNHVFRDGQAPKPLSFVNTVSNSAAFYVAKCLQLESRSSFVCNRYFAFESALQLAATDLQLGAVSSVLIGTVDSAVLPLEGHRQRLELDAITPLAEASHWLWLTRDAPDPIGASGTSGSALCTITDVYNASDQVDLLQWIAAQQLKNNYTSLSAGQYLSEQDFADIKARTGMDRTFDYRHSRGYYASQSGAVISEFLRARNSSRALLHINSDSLGRYCAILAKSS